jgi:hypothetical protein
MEFLRMISDEANELCSKQGKRNISPEHIMQVSFAVYVAYLCDITQELVQIRTKYVRWCAALVFLLT